MSVRARGEARARAPGVRDQHSRSGARLQPLHQVAVGLHGRVEVFAQLVRRVLVDVRRLVPQVAEPLSWRVVVEKRATFAAEVGRWCPPLRAAGPGCYLAGDWLMPDYPATLEGAVRSGVAAARALLADYQS